jgi:hypothetical protein
MGANTKNRGPRGKAGGYIVAVPSRRSWQAETRMGGNNNDRREKSSKEQLERYSEPM